MITYCTVYEKVFDLNVDERFKISQLVQPYFTYKFGELNSDCIKYKNKMYFSPKLHMVY